MYYTGNIQEVFRQYLDSIQVVPSKLYSDIIQAVFRKYSDSVQAVPTQY